MSPPSITYPGLLLPTPSSSAATLPGPGTHIHDSRLYASLAGRLTTASSTSKSSPSTTYTSSTASILSIPRLPPTNDFSITSNTLPKVGSVVLGKVIRVTARQVGVAIVVVDGEVCRDEWAGVVRMEDVRGWEKEKVNTYEGFRAGDTVRGEVISLGDQANYYLTTARNDLGVLMAKSEYRNQMVPISWKEFRDPVTGLRESRKVAKPF